LTYYISGFMRKSSKIRPNPLNRIVGEYFIS
jgi:hypothetical protein